MPSDYGQSKSHTIIRFDWTFQHLCIVRIANFVYVYFTVDGSDMMNKMVQLKFIVFFVGFSLLLLLLFGLYFWRNVSKWTFWAYGCWINYYYYLSNWFFDCVITWLLVGSLIRSNAQCLLLEMGNRNEYNRKQHSLDMRKMWVLLFIWRETTIEQQLLFN